MLSLSSKKSWKKKNKTKEKEALIKVIFYSGPKQVEFLPSPSINTWILCCPWKALSKEIVEVITPRKGRLQWKKQFCCKGVEINWNYRKKNENEKYLVHRVTLSERSLSGRQLNCVFLRRLNVTCVA